MWRDILEQFEVYFEWQGTPPPYVLPEGSSVLQKVAAPRPEAGNEPQPYNQRAQSTTTTLKSPGSSDPSLHR